MIDEASQPCAPDTEWIAVGRTLADQRREMDWLLADWLRDGREAGHVANIKFNALGEAVGIMPQRLKEACKAATVFPPALRNPLLSVEHHAAIASLPQDEAQPLLQRAVAERLPVKALREHVTQRRYETGANFKDEDVDSTLATLQIRAWNRATPEARAMAFEQFKIAAANGLGIVDEDEAADA